MPRILITGASDGIGAEMALQLARHHQQSLQLTLAARNLDNLQSVADQCQAHGAQLLAVPTDVSDEAACRALVAQSAQQFGGLDVLVNNAGIAGPTAGIADIAPQELDATLDINLASQFHTVRHALPALRAAGGGSIINISSVAGRMGVPMRTPYAATKWGVVGLTRSLAVELGGYGIRVNALLPGLVAGPRIDRVIEARARNMGLTVEEETRLELSGVSLRQFVRAADIANMALFLASPFGAMVSGQAISIDGDLQSLPWQPPAD